MEHTYINIITLTKLLKRRVWKYLFSVIIGAAVGCFVAFNMPKQYSTEVKFSPSTGKERSGFLDDISDLIGDKNYGAYEDAIYPEIYSDVIKSDTFVNSILEVPVSMDGRSDGVSFMSYLKEHQKIPFWSKMRIMLQKSTIQDEVKACVSCDVDRMTGLLSIKVTTQNPYVSSQIADTISARLQNKITEYRLAKKRRDLQYLQNLANRTRQDYQEAKEIHTKFMDENFESEEPKVVAEQEKLEQEVSMKYNVYESVMEQQTENYIEMKLEEPVFTRVQSAAAYERPVSKSKIVPIAGCMIFAVFLHALIIILINNKKIFSKE